MRVQILLAGAAVSLAGCSQPAPTSSPTTTAVGANAATPAMSVAPAPVKPVSRVPGEWEYVTRIEMLEVSGDPPAAITERMKAGPQTDTRRVCMTREEAEEDLSKTLEQDQGGCRFERVQGGANTIAGTAICSIGGMEATGKMTGTVTPTEMDRVVDMTMKLPGPATAPDSSVKMRATVTGRRVGDCAK